MFEKEFTKWLEDEMKEAEERHKESMACLEVVDGVEYDQKSLREIDNEDFDSGYDLGFYEAIKTIKEMFEKVKRK
jgi:hypothetical protein